MIAAAFATMPASLALELAGSDTSPSAVERFLTGRVLSFVDTTGIGCVLSEAGAFSPREAVRLLEERLGFALTDPVRSRMIRVLLDLLMECGWLRPAANGRRTFAPSADAPPAISFQPLTGVLADDGQLTFFERCLAHVPTFLRGGPPLFDFDASCAPDWDALLGNDGIARARTVLARLLLPRDNRPCDALVLCYGPGFDLALIERRCPAARVTALDFTDAFLAGARRRLQAPGRVRWPDAESWGGFGCPLPFADEAFDLVTLSCAEPYIPRGQRHFVLADLVRVLRPGGVVGVLTHSYPDAARQAVPDDWVRRTTYCHDFLESVCRGWQGFLDAASLRTSFEGAGFRVDLVTHNASIWRLSKPAVQNCAAAVRGGASSAALEGR